MKAVMLSIQPKWCEKIASGEKTVEVRKTRPKIETPFKCFIYCTKDEPMYRSGEKFWCKIAGDFGNGKVIGEFVCDKIDKGVLTVSRFVDSTNIGSEETCVSIDELKAYFGIRSVERTGIYVFYGWHISDLVIYDKPKELGEFFKACDKPPLIDCSKCVDQKQNVCKPLSRPPQSWSYVEVNE